MGLSYVDGLGAADVSNNLPKRKLTSLIIDNDKRTLIRRMIDKNMKSVKVEFFKKTIF